MTPQTFLHIGCGPKHKDRTTRGFNSDDWIELRFDIDQNSKQKDSHFVSTKEKREKTKGQSLCLRKQKDSHFV